MKENRSIRPETLEPRVAAELLKAFSHVTRLSILQELLAGPKCVTDMEELLPARQANISQHLAILRDKKILKTRKDSNKVYYRIADQRILHLVALTRRVFCGVGPSEAKGKTR